MADDEAPPDEGLDPNDLGEPIAELALLEEVPSSGFVGRLINVLRRRSLSSQLATLGWTGLGEVFTEFLKMIMSSFGSTSRNEGAAD